MSIAALINNLLQQDLQASEYLHKHASKILHFTCKDAPVINFYCLVNDNGIIIQRQSVSAISCSISAPLLSFLRLLTQSDANVTELGLEISGDYECAQELQRVIVNLSIDWEEELSKYTGDVIAVRAIHHLKKLRNYQQNNATALEQMVVEYLQHEAKFLPTQYEVSEFNHEIDDLRLQVDRLEAKIKLLRSRKQQHAGC